MRNVKECGLGELSLDRAYLPGSSAVSTEPLKDTTCLDLRTGNGECQSPYLSQGTYVVCVCFAQRLENMSGHVSVPQPAPASMPFVYVRK